MFFSSHDQYGTTFDMYLQTKQVCATELVELYVL